MVPTPITTEEWAQIGNALKLLWVALFLAIAAGSTLLTAHAIIPSAVATRTIPERWAGLRIPLYVFGLLALVGVVISFFLASQQLDFIHRLYPRYWQ